MPRITLKETVTRNIDIPMDALYDLVDNLTDKERAGLLERLAQKRPVLKPFKGDEIKAIVADFAATSLYEDDFLKDLEQGLKKTSFYK
jgi:hypothetical protein